MKNEQFNMSTEETRWICWQPEKLAHRQQQGN